MCTKIEGFHPKIQRRRFGEIKFPGLGGVLKTSYHFTTLQEVMILPTLVLFPPFRLILGGCCIDALRGYLAGF